MCNPSYFLRVIHGCSNIPSKSNRKFCWVLKKLEQQERLRLEPESYPGVLVIISWSIHVSWFCTTALICTCKMITESQFGSTLVHALRTICFLRENSLASRCKPINKTWKKLVILWGSKNPFKNLSPVLEKAKMEYGEEYLVGGFNIQDVDKLMASLVANCC